MCVCVCAAAVARFQFFSFVVVVVVAVVGSLYFFQLCSTVYVDVLVLVGDSGYVGVYVRVSFVIFCLSSS